MRYSIVHQTDYTYSQPVFLEPHTVRLRPRADGDHHLLSYTLDIDPEPTGRAEFLDPEGNSITRMWFDDLIPSLRVTARMDVRNELSNPFDFLIDPAAEHVPVQYASDHTPHLAPYLRADVPVADSVRTFAEAVADEAGHDTLPFLILLPKRVYELCKTVIREEGEPFAAEETLARKEGSCRDHAVLCVEACRALGLAARFVSGYQEGDPGEQERYLHAWTEVYIPRGGWRGLDPTHGLMVADRHIPLAAAAISRNAAPITGSFRGTEATAVMKSTLAIEHHDD